MGDREARHRLLAILAADAVGFSRLMAIDDRSTLAALDAARSLFHGQVESNGGRVVDTAGDSILAVFDAASPAVRAALDVQPLLMALQDRHPGSGRLLFRIGVHLGDVIEKQDGSVYGDGVNVASRLQSLAEAGGTVISQTVHGAVHNRIRARFEDFGEHSMKNIEYPLRVFKASKGTDAGPVPIPMAPAVPASSTTNLRATFEPLIGRDADITAVRALLASHRVVTIAGSGGIGKTRLAQAVGITQTHAHGVWWIDLAAVSSADKIVPAVANVTGLGLSEGDQIAALAQALSERDTLLILDNCEHLIEDVATTVSCAIGASRLLRILATSQEPLKVPGEHLYRLDVLAVPPPGTSLPVARDFGALQLLETRANAVDQSFALNEASVEAAIDLCNRLDGIALAIEMAAARLPILGFTEVRRRLGQRFNFFRNLGRTAPARQQTLRATLDWSFSLLTAADQAVLRRVSTFVGSFRLDSAAQVARADDIDEWAALDAVENLSSKSLVHVLRLDPPRYRLLETVRMYALEQLAQSGELTAAQAAHGAAMARLASEGERDFWLLGDGAWSARYALDMDDFDAAFMRACERQDVLVATAAGQVLARRDQFSMLGASERHRRAEAAYPLLAVALPREQAVIWDWLASCSPLVACGVPRLTAAREAVSRWQTLDEPRQTYLALGRLVFESANAGDLVGASAAVLAAREIEEPAWPPRLFLIVASNISRYNEYGDARTYREGSQRELEFAELSGAATAAAFARLQLADAASTAGDFLEAVALGRAVVEEQRFLGKRSALSTALSNLCGALLVLGELRAAGEAALEAWPIRLEANTAFLLDHISFLATQLDEYGSSAKILAYADARYARSQIVRLPNEARSAERARASIETFSRSASRPIDLSGGEHLSDEQLDVLVRLVLSKATPIQGNGDHADLVDSRGRGK